MYTLVTAANSAEAHKLKNKLGAANILLGDYLDLPEFMLKAGNIIRLPNPASASYSHEMLTLCLDKGISVIYALRDDELALLKKAEILFNEYGIQLKEPPMTAYTNELMNQ